MRRGRACATACASPARRSARTSTSTSTGSGQRSTRRSTPRSRVRRDRGDQRRLTREEGLLHFPHHISPAWRNGRAAPISCVGGDLAQVHDRERELTREVSQTVTQGLPGVEVLAVELTGRERFTVYIDHPQGVDHALCARVTGLLRGYLDGTPWTSRPRDRAPAAHACTLPQRGRPQGRAAHGRRDRRPEALPRRPLPSESASAARSRGKQVDIPFEAIVRGNLVDEGQ